MSFRKNEAQQMSIFDSTFGLTEREKKALDNSWAKVFAEDIFPNIDENRFSVLYSSNDASRPNTPINVLVGAEIIKLLFDESDDDMVENLMLDIRYKVALHTTSFKEQPLSDKSLSRFRRRCYDYEQTHGIDLYHDCVVGLAESVARMMNIDKRIRRMDSLMIESGIKKLSRMELIYTCIAKFVTFLHKNDRDDLIGHMEHYYDPNDFNKVIYHCRDTEANDKINVLMKDSQLLLDRCSGLFDEATEYQLLVRCLSEQTVFEDGQRRLRTKADGGMTSEILQNPSDPDATYREKAGKAHRGYSANIEESVGANGSVVTEYQVDKNTRSDSSFLKEHLEKLECQEDTTTLIADGAYSGDENTKLAESKNISLITTELAGKDVDVSIGAFSLSEDGSKVNKCLCGNVPKNNWFNKKTGIITASFDRNQCANCPYKIHCKPKIFKRVSKVTISQKMVNRAITQSRMKTDEFKLLAKLRNGVETIPSILKNVYGVGRKSIRGLLRVKHYFGSSVAALNFRKLFRFRKGLGHYALNPVLN